MLGQVALYRAGMPALMIEAYSQWVSIRGGAVSYSPVATQRCVDYHLLGTKLRGSIAGIGGPVRRRKTPVIRRNITGLVVLDRSGDTRSLDIY
jgi:hypothetical protein